MSDLTISFLRAIASLSVTLALIVLVGWAYKRFGTTFTPRPKAASRLNVIESRRLGQHTNLHLIQLDDTEHLVATTASQTTLLHSKPLKPTKAK